MVEWLLSRHGAWSFISCLDSQNHRIIARGLRSQISGGMYPAYRQCGVPLEHVDNLQGDGHPHPSCGTWPFVSHLHCRDYRITSRRLGQNASSLVPLNHVVNLQVL